MREPYEFMIECGDNGSITFVPLSVCANTDEKPM